MVVLLRFILLGLMKREQDENFFREREEVLELLKTDILIELSSKRD